MSPTGLSGVGEWGCWEAKQLKLMPYLSFTCQTEKTNIANLLSVWFCYSVWLWKLGIHLSKKQLKWNRNSINKLSKIKSKQQWCFKTYYACTNLITEDVTVKISLSILKVTCENKNSWTEGGQISKQAL